MKTEFGILFLSIMLSACDQPETSPAPETYEFRVPAGFPVPSLDADNPLSEEGVELGRRLFYDVRLSGNNSISCASCHAPELAFTDGVALSKAGVSGTTLHRHAPALFNLAWSGNGLFWDGGATNLESQAFGPLTAADEMHRDLDELVEELKADRYYQESFAGVFQTDITQAGIVKALAQFQRTLVSANSRYDRYKRKESNASLTPAELQGLQLVVQKCQGCHQGELFTDNQYHNNGIDDDFTNDALEGIYQGRFRITYNEADLGKFKTPTLRNVALTAPYMHDGRFSTLDEVLDHYSENIRSSATLDALLPAKGLGLSSIEKQQIIAFLQTLTDYELINNPKFQKP